MKAGKIILVTMDTLRADRLGCYGNGRGLTPNLDALASEGASYPYAFSPCTYTVPVHTSILTGLYPINHNLGFTQKKGRIDADQTVFLQEALREAGYRTAAFVSSFVLRKDWGLDRGFDLYDDTMTAAELNRPADLIRDGRETTSAALDWIKDQKDRDFFVWVHYFDVHGPYVPRQGFEDRLRPEDYGDAPVELDVVPDGAPGGIPEYQVLGAERDPDGKIISCERDIRRYLAGYDMGVMYQDEVFGELVGGLKSLGVYDETMLAVTSDHGEALGEGGVYFFHGLTVTPEQTLVPLIVKPAKGLQAPPAGDLPVSTVDIMPTLLECAGIPYDGLTMDGERLGSSRPERFILAENEWQCAAVWGEYCYLTAKDVVYDGFEYYFDSQPLCRKSLLMDYKTGKELAIDPDGPAGELVRYAVDLMRTVGPKERRIRDKDRIISEKDLAIKQLERAVSDKDREVSELRTELVKAREEVKEWAGNASTLEKELAGVYSSRSWRITYPIRWVSAMLKGIRPR